MVDYTKYADQLTFECLTIYQNMIYHNHILCAYTLTIADEEIMAFKDYGKPILCMIDPPRYMYITDSGDPNYDPIYRLISIFHPTITGTIRLDKPTLITIINDQYLVGLTVMSNEIMDDVFEKYPNLLFIHYKATKTTITRDSEPFSIVWLVSHFTKKPKSARNIA